MGAQEGLGWTVPRGNVRSIGAAARPDVAEGPSDLASGGSSAASLGKWFWGSSGLRTQ